MNQWYYSLSLRNKLLIGTYGILTVYTILMLGILSMLNQSIIAPMIIAVVTAVLAFPVITIVERAISHSIEEMSDVARRISKGDFTHKIDIGKSASLGELGHSFNGMVDKLRDILTETGSITRQVAESSRNIFERNNEIRVVMEQVAASANELATGASEISEDVTDMSDSIHEIEGKVASYANSTKVMNDRSEQMKGLVSKGRDALEVQSVGVQRNVEATAKVSQTIEELAQKARGISQITSTISDIAEQTNLLSLNASIEAARAGEHGRGFAVVAQEVRQLAEESSASTKQVFDLVKSIDQGIRQTIEHMKINEDVVHLQTEHIRDSEQIFTEIIHSVEFITQQIYAFSQESDAMLDSAQKIGAAIQNISAITQQSAAGTEQVSASMNEQISSVQTVVTETEQMLNMSTQLQRTIQVFKVK